MRLIDADELVKKIDKFILESVPLARIFNSSFAEGLEDGYYRIRSEIYAMPNMYNMCRRSTSQQWIPCSERLPDEDVDVLIYLYEGVPFIAWVDSKGRWCTEDFDIAKEDEPIAWIPLPQPYRGDE